MKQLFRRGLGLAFRPVQLVLYGLSGLFPRDPLTWAFGTWSGKRFADNSAAVFVHLNQHPERIRTVWITRRRAIRDDLRGQGMKAFTAWSPGGVWWSLRSGVYVYDSMPSDINYWLSRGAHLALLMHGTGMKKIERGIDVPEHRLYKLFHGKPHEKLVWRLALPWHLAVPSLVAVCSPDHARQAELFYGVEPDAARITGLPRHDRLAVATDVSRVDIPTVGAEIPSDRPVFLYLPTFREGVSRQGFDWTSLHDAASKADVTIAIKFHVVDAERGVLGMEEIEQAEHLRLVEPTIDPVNIYAQADGLITDFSSVAYDLLLLDRPVIHFVPDLEGFLTDRPLIAPFEDLAVGPICRDTNDLADALIAAADPTDQATISQRHTARERCFTYPPGGASERVVTSIRSLIE